MKTCSLCKLQKTLDAFPKKGKYYNSWCYKCIAVKQALYRKNHPDYYKQWSIKNADKIRRAGALWRKKNRERVLANKKLYRERHPERARAQVRAAWKKNGKKYRTVGFRWWLKKKYGLTEQAYQEMLSRQNGRCKICGKLFGLTKGRYPNIDHCHVANKIRGLLCFQCNVLLGMARDNISILRKAIIYLEGGKLLQNSQVSSEYNTGSVLNIV
jgi:hypothetical protein